MLHIKTAQFDIQITFLHHHIHKLQTCTRSSAIADKPSELKITLQTKNNSMH